MMAWRCAECGVEAETRERACDCPTAVVLNTENGENAWKTGTAGTTCEAANRPSSFLSGEPPECVGGYRKISPKMASAINAAVVEEIRDAIDVMEFPNVFQDVCSKEFWDDFDDSVKASFDGGAYNLWVDISEGDVMIQVDGDNGTIFKARMIDSLAPLLGPLSDEKREQAAQQLEAMVSAVRG